MKRISLLQLQTFLPYCMAAYVAMLLLGSCQTTAIALKQEKNYYPGTIYFANGETKTGRVGLPRPSDPTLLFIENGTNTYFDANEIDRVEYKEGATIARYLPVKIMFKTQKTWVIQIAQGPYLSAYIAAEGYELNNDGSIVLKSMRRVTHTGNGRMIENPSFPIYMQKKGDTKLSLVAMKAGIQFEGSAFRSGISRFLADDPKLCEYIRYHKMGTNDIETVAKDYNPHRGDGDLVINNVVIGPLKKPLITKDLDKEMFWYLETATPADKTYGTQFGIGIRSSRFKLLAYGADLGYASAKYIDEIKRIENHPGGAWVTAPVTPEDFSKTGLFRFNLSSGLQLPLDLKKFYLVPAAHFTFGGMFSSDFSTFNYGPMGTLDIGFKFSKGNMLLIGGGYRYNIPWKDETEKAEGSAPGFAAYEPYGSLLFRVSYKF